tara:strand:+ start:1695 stop:2828 length:1134 start_codon:yes stop_codon:yes gene_type:complete
MKNNLHTSLFAVFLALLGIPFLLMIFSYESSPLKGAYQKVERKSFSFDSFYDGTYQVQLEKEEKFLNSTAPTFIRVRNQVDFDVFKKSHMGDGLLGLEGYMFGKGWAKAYSGNRKYTDAYFDSITEKLKDLNNVFDSLGKVFMVVIPPCKEGLFSNMLPEGFEKKGKSDYDSYLEALNKHDVRHIDFTQYYQEVIDTSKYPVYSKTGSHWTMYGAHLAMSIIVDSIETLLDTNLLDYKVASYRFSEFDRGDGDLEGPLNLVFNIDKSIFAYPSYVFDSTLNYYRPKVIIVGDSFYWGVNNSYVPSVIYSDQSKYLYYYSTCYPNSDKPGYPVSNLNIEEEFGAVDVFLLFSGSYNLNGFPFGLEKDFDAIISRLKGE